MLNDVVLLVREIAFSVLSTAFHDHAIFDAFSTLLELSLQAIDLLDTLRYLQSIMNVSDKQHSAVVYSIFLQ